jgi:hypothetical protein
MSILDAWVTPTEAIVAVDTDGARDDGSRFAASKMLPMPHLGCVLALRGQAAFLSMLFVACASAGFDSVDELDDVMPALLEEVHAGIPAHLFTSAAHVKPGNELLLVGWSERRDAMLGRQFILRAGEPLTARDFGQHISPWDADAMRKVPTTPHDVDKIALAQVEWMRAKFDSPACGGKLLVAHVSQKGIAIGARMRFPTAVTA